MDPKLFWTSVFLIGFVYGLYYGMWVEMSPFVNLCAALTLSLGIVFWLHKDMRLRHYYPAFDSRMFLFCAWPLVGPYYLIRTRGWKAIGPIAGFVALYAGGEVLGYFIGVFVMER